MPCHVTGTYPRASPRHPTSAMERPDARTPAEYTPWPNWPFPAPRALVAAHSNKGAIDTPRRWEQTGNSAGTLPVARTYHSLLRVDTAHGRRSTVTSRLPMHLSPGVSCMVVSSLTHHMPFVPHSTRNCAMRCNFPELRHVSSNFSTCSCKQFGLAVVDGLLLQPQTYYICFKTWNEFLS